MILLWKLVDTDLMCIILRFFEITFRFGDRVAVF